MHALLQNSHPYVRSLCYFFLPLPCTPITEYVKNTMGLELPETLKDFEEASFDSGVEVGKKFRPWLDNERYYFLHKYCEIFNDVFQINNIELSAESKGFLEGDAKLRKIFEGVEKVNKPRVLYRPYVLDRVLKHEHIDLLEDLKKRV